MAEPARYDLFLSYARPDGSRARRLRDALARHGLTVWFDDAEVCDFDALTARIQIGLRCSRALVACYSTVYGRRRWTMAEFTAAYIAALQLDQVEQRILPVNLESGIEHVFPVSMRDRLLPGLQSEQADATELAATIAGRIGALEEPLGNASIGVQPKWFGAPRLSSPRFVDRVREQWLIHDALTSPIGAFASGPPSRGLCQLRAMGGFGKSLLAEEYAWRFAAAWPAAVFWLDAGGGQAHDGTDEQAADATERLQSALATVVQQLGGTPAAMSIDSLRTEIRTRFEECEGLGLWIVDDVPHGLPSKQFLQWLAPATRMRTLVTTRSRAYDQGATIDLEGLPPDAAAELVSGGSAAHESIPPWAPPLARALGFLPLALDVTQSALPSMRGVKTPEQFLASLDDESQDVLELAADLARELPNGHEKSVANTFLMGMRVIPPEARELLQYSCLLAHSPIPIQLLIRARRAAGASARVAETDVLRGAAALEKAALCSRTGRGEIMVHALLARTVRQGSRESDWAGSATRALTLAVIVEMRGFERFGDLPELSVLAPHARALLEGAGEMRFAVQHVLGQYAYTTRNAPRAAELLQLAWRGAAPVLGPEHLETAALANEFGLAAAEAGRPADALPAFQLHERVCAAAGLEEAVIMSRGNRASALRDLGRIEEAIGLEREVLAWRRRHLGADAPLTLTSCHQLSILEDRNGDLQSALELERYAFRERKRTLGDDHMHTLLSMQSLAQLESNAGNAVEASELAEQNARRRVRLLGKSHPYSQSGLRVLLSLSRQAGAVLKDLGIELSDIEKTTWQHWNNHAVHLIATGDYVGALASIDLIDRNRLPLPSDRMMVDHNELAALVELGRQVAARTLAQQLMSLQEHELGPGHWLTLASRLYASLNELLGTAPPQWPGLLAPIVECMRSHQTASSMHLSRAEAELLLARAMAAPASVTRDEATRLWTKCVAERGRRDFVTLLVEATRALIDHQHGLDGAQQDAITTCAVFTETFHARHPGTTMATWIACRILRERDHARWSGFFAQLAWLAQASSDERGRVGQTVLAEMHRLDWACP